MKSIFDGSIQESTPFGGQWDRNFSMSQFKQFIFSSKSMMCVKLNSLGLHVAHNCVISNIFYCHMSIWHLPFISRHIKWKNAFNSLTFSSLQPSPHFSIPSLRTFFISICVELQLKLFQLNFPLVHATAPGIVRFYFYYVYSSPTNIIVPLLPAYIDRNNNETWNDFLYKNLPLDMVFLLTCAWWKKAWN